MNWIRVSRQQRCPQCDKPDWCLISPDSRAVICMRIESNHPLKCGGWLHRKEGDVTLNPRKTSRVSNGASKVQSSDAPDFSKLIETWQSQRNGELEPYAATLGVSRQSLLDLGTCYAKEYRAFAFPMYSTSGEIVGVRLRSDTRKWAIKGSRSALFIAWNAIRLGIKKILIVEGPTDCAAGLTLGFFTIGRPNCSGCVEMVVEAVRQLGVAESIIVADNDERWTEVKPGDWRYIRPGIYGAERLAEALPCRSVRVALPTKDLRAFIGRGGTRQLLESLVQSCIRT